MVIAIFLNLNKTILKLLNGVIVLVVMCLTVLVTNC